MRYSSRLLHLALPIIAQQFVSSSLNLIGGLMVGQLGETSMAAVGLSNQVFFLLTFLLFGTSSGIAIFTAQLWGKEDIENIRRVFGLGLIVAFTGSLFFFIMAVFFPGAALSVYTTDPAVIALGVPYLRLVGLSYFFTAFTFMLAASMRSTGDVRTPLAVSFSALTINTVLSYALIFGKLGLPRMDVNGVAVASTISRLLECAGLIAAARLRRSPVLGTLRQTFSFTWDFAKSVLGRALPVTFNEMLWSLGISTYNAIYAHIGTDAIAAVNITSTIESLAFVIFIGISDATAILVGHQIGRGAEHGAYKDARTSLFLGMAGAAGMGVVLYFIAPHIVNLYKVSATVTEYALNILVVISATLWLRVSNMTLFVGIFRSGGDTRFGFLLDALGIWLVGVPAALAGAFLLHLPVYWVYLMVMSEEALKCVVALFRFFSGKWIHNVTHGLREVMSNEL